MSYSSPQAGYSVGSFYIGYARRTCPAEPRNLTNLTNSTNSRWPDQFTVAYENQKHLMGTSTDPTSGWSSNWDPRWSSPNGRASLFPNGNIY